MTDSGKRGVFVVLLLGVGAAIVLVKAFAPVDEELPEPTHPAQEPEERRLKRIREDYPTVPPPPSVPTETPKAEAARPLPLQPVETASPEVPETGYTIDRTGEAPTVSIAPPRPIVERFDPDVWPALTEGRNRLAYLTYTKPVRDCAIAFMERNGYESWVLGGIAEVKMKIHNEVLRFDDVDIKEFGTTGFGDRPPDDEFKACYRAAVQAASLRCSNCKDGELRLTVKLRSHVYDPNLGPMNEIPPGTADPATDPAFAMDPV